MNDIINGLFEFSGGIFLWLNVWKLYQHKSVKGVSLWAFGFFAVWGYWNLYYYPCLNQWVSLTGSVLVVTANTMWVILAWRYKKKMKFQGDCLFDFTLCLPFIKIHTETFCYHFESREWVYFQIYITIWKWKINLRLGRKGK